MIEFVFYGADWCGVFAILAVASLIGLNYTEFFMSIIVYAAK